jgi:hypothetical protein
MATVGGARSPPVVLLPRLVVPPQRVLLSSLPQ